MESKVLEIAQVLEPFAYVGTFVILYLCGVLLPIPEEPILIAAGYAAYQSGGAVDVHVLVACAMAGILLGDLTIFSIGRRHGDWLFRSRVLRRLLPDERLARARRLYAEHGTKVVFFGRFVAGVRFVAFFTAGNLGVPCGAFLFYDLLAALITVPISIYLPYHFGSDIERGLHALTRFRHWVFGALGAALLIVFAVRWVRGRRRARAAAESLAGAPADPPTSVAGGAREGPR
jgi:membrane protein DedA with SNARE-associated domain